MVQAPHRRRSRKRPLRVFDAVQKGKRTHFLALPPGRWASPRYSPHPTAARRSTSIWPPWAFGPAGPGTPPSSTGPSPGGRQRGGCQPCGALAACWASEPVPTLQPGTAWAPSTASPALRPRSTRRVPGHRGRRCGEKRLKPDHLVPGTRVGTPRASAFRVTCRAQPRDELLDRALRLFLQR